MALSEFLIICELEIHLYFGKWLKNYSLYNINPSPEKLLKLMIRKFFPEVFMDAILLLMAIPHRINLLLIR